MSPAKSYPILPEEAAAIGLWQYGLLPTREIPFSPAVRETCAGNACRGYGATWACPPAVGSLEDCRAQCLSFPQTLVFSSRYPLEDSFDIEGMRSAMRSFNPWQSKRPLNGKLVSYQATGRPSPSPS